ncbi:MAG: polysaccharide export protein [Magnetococcales bacterium]|nr:polysaccharide export protein [Magnetococcales bacterium]
MILGACSSFESSPSPDSMVTAHAMPTGQAVAFHSLDAYQNLPLGPGDEIDIRFYRETNLNRSIRIDGAGKINFPLIGDFKVKGLTIAEAEAELTRRLKKYLLEPRVDINVTTFRSRRAFVVGEVESPGPLSLDRPIQVWEAVHMSGGFSVEANQENVLMLRREEDSLKASVVNLDASSFKGGVENIPEAMATQLQFVEHGDILYVPPKAIVSFGRFMGQLNAIVNPIYTIEKGILIGPDVEDILLGNRGGGGGGGAPAL